MKKEPIYQNENIIVFKPVSLDEVIEYEENGYDEIETYNEMFFKGECFFVSEKQ